MLKGSDYVAVRRISNAADETLADVGESCDEVPPEVLAHFAATGAIRKADPPAKPEKRGRKAQE